MAICQNPIYINMKKRFILIGFSNYKQNGLLVKAQSIIASITGNAKFPSPIPALDVVIRATDAYSNALAMPNGKETTQLRAKTRAQLTAVLKQLGDYVNTTANGDAVALASSGFDMNKGYSKVGPLPAPEGLTPSPLTGGSVKLRIKKVHGANSYCFQYALITNGVIGDWVNVLATKTETVIEGLQPLKEYAFRAAAVGADPRLTFSSVVTSGIL